MRFVNQPIRKKDAMQLLSGKPVYTQDIAPADCLVVKLLRSVHANAIIKEIDCRVAEKIEASKPYSLGKTFPRTAEDLPLPDRLIRSPAPMTGLSLTVMYVM